jgi:hypothetical protein
MRQGKRIKTITDVVGVLTGKFSQPTRMILESWQENLWLTPLRGAVKFEPRDHAPRRNQFVTALFSQLTGRS